MPSAPCSFSTAVSLGDLLVLLVGERDLSRLFVAVAHIGQLDLVVGLERADAAGEIGRVLDHLAVELGDHVAGLEAGLSRRRSRHRLVDDRALGASSCPCSRPYPRSPAGC